MVETIDRSGWALIREMVSFAISGHEVLRNALPEVWRSDRLRRSCRGKIAGHPVGFG